MGDPKPPSVESLDNNLSAEKAEAVEKCKKALELVADAIAEMLKEKLHQRAGREGLSEEAIRAEERKHENLRAMAKERISQDAAMLADDEAIRLMNMGGGHEKLRYASDLLDDGTESPGYFYIFANGMEDDYISKLESILAPKFEEAGLIFRRKERGS